MTRRRTLAVTILVCWAVTLGWHVRREYFQPELAVLERGARSLAPGTYFYAVKMNEATIGTASSRLDTIAGGFVFDDNILLDIPALDTVRRAVIMTRVELSPALELRSFRFRMTSEIGGYEVAGAVPADTLLELVVGAGAEPRRERVRVPRGVTFDAVIPFRLAASGALVPGRGVTARIFDPSALAERDVRVAVTAADTLIVPDTVYLDDAGWWQAQSYDTVPVWRIEQNYAGVALASWVDEDGMLVRAESPLGFTIERTAFELAQQEWRATGRRGDLAAGYGAMIEGTAISSNVALADVEERPRLHLRLRNVDLGGFDLHGGRQQLRGDTLVVVRETDAQLEPGYTLPWSAGGEPAAELGGTLLIQTKDARIVEAARGVAAGSSDPAVVARRLNDWVYRALRKEITPSVPSAVQVLAARRGDCNEHTVLYIALARALGLPARTAVGLVHVRGRFYYHAWPEVWLGSDWVAVDPTLGQFPADASHIRLLIGGLARQVELIRLIGRLQVEVI